jgi:hypothetical protein
VTLPEEQVVFFVDSGAGQSMCACSEAFHTLWACAVLVVGVAGSMPAHGIGTAWFVLKMNGIEQIMKIHNCLLCHGEDRFNLISVSQMLRTRQNEVTFSAEESRIKLTKEHVSTVIGLNENEGLYELEVSPLYADDDRKNTLPSWDLTLEEDPLLWQESAKKQEGTGMKAPTKLGVWYCKVFSITRKVGLGSIQENY